MTPQQIEAMKLALEALEGVLDNSPKVLDAFISGGLYEVVQCREAITAIKEALAEHAMRETQRLGQEIEQEPVAWMSKDKDIVYTSIQVDGYFQHDHIPLYTRPPQRTWVGLTDEDFQPMVQKAMVYYGYKPEHSTLTSGAGFYALVRNIEAKLKQKNGYAEEKNT